MCTALPLKVVTAMFSASVTCESVTLEAVRGNMSYHHTQLCLRTGSRCRSLAKIDSSSYLAKSANCYQVASYWYFSRPVVSFPTSGAQAVHPSLDPCWPIQAAPPFEREDGWKEGSQHPPIPTLCYISG